MDRHKVIAELQSLMADPLLKESARAIAWRIEENSPIGKITIHLLEKAERGSFK